jgi:hypothetical protein
MLPFGGRHAQAVEALQTGVPKRLENNRKLQRQLQQAMEPAWVQEGSGLFLRTSTMPFDGEKLEDLLKYIARGLTWHHWNAYIGPDYYVSVMFMSDTLGMAFQQIVRSWRVGARASSNIGQGTVEYEGVQAADAPGLTVWLIAAFGGVMLSDSRTRIAHRPAETSSRWWVITGPPEIARQIEDLKATGR